MRIVKVLQDWIQRTFDSLKALPKNVWLSLRRRITSITSLFQDFKDHPQATKSMVLSALLMGLGQFKNKQTYKALFFLGFFLVYVAVELATSGYLGSFAEMAEFPDDFGIIYARDYGGLFVRGLWGFFTLGELVVFDFYRGGNIRLQDNVTAWRSADVSNVLLGQGIIVIVLVALLLAVYIANVVDAYKTAKLISAGEEPESFASFRKRAFDDYFAYIIIIPAGILIMFLTLVPFLYSFLIAFTNYTTQIQSGAQLIRWVGFDNFGLYLFQAEWLQFFGNVFVWTIIWAIMSSVTVYSIGFFQAIVVESRYIKYKKLYRLIMILPWAIPGLVSLLVFRNVFASSAGLANILLIEFGVLEQAKDFLRAIGLLGQSPEIGVILWYTEPANGNLTKALIVLVNLWMGSPYFMLLITGILGTIPAELYEAADIDGATDTQKFKFITWPWVLRATMPVIITTFTFNFNNFGAIYFLTAGGPGYPLAQIPESLRVTGAMPGQTDILISWIYKIAFANNPARYNLASTYSIVVFVIVGLFAIYNLSKVKGFWEED
jgi:arabinogalactan oligomer / maltooligosaccharide transport system permease protein